MTASAARIPGADTFSSGEGRRPLSPHLQRLEDEAIFVMREVVAEFRNPVMLYSVGKDSSVMLHIARKAFYPAPPPFPFLHIASGWDFRALIDHRDRIAGKYGLNVLVHSNEAAAAAGVTPFDTETGEYSRQMLTETLKAALDQHGFDAAFGGGRRDEEKARAKERIFSFRDEFGQWDPKNQRPELWDIYNARTFKGENIRAFPISNWTELDVWQYIEREQLELPSIYYAHRRQVVRRGGAIVPVTELTPAKAGEEVVESMVRFRTVGDITCTAPVESAADSIAKIIAETALTTITERGATRLDDQTSEAAMEQRKKEGYF